MAVAKRIRIKCGFSLGDIVALTGAVRELNEQYPGQFLSEIDTSASEVWRHNPYVTFSRGHATIVDCDKVLIDRSGRSGHHYIQAYVNVLNQALGTSATLQKIAGDIHLSDEERNWHSDVWSLCKQELPFWLVCSGGKFDLPVKWWSHDRCQQVVDHFRGRIQFVQVGTWGNFHPKLKGAIDLRGKTGVRDLIHLTYYAQGVLCGVTSLMHLAAAVPTETGEPRPAIVIAGAREPQDWEKYPHHLFLHKGSQVRCSPCWKHSHFDIPGLKTKAQEGLKCVETARGLPRCMDLVSANTVIDCLELLIKEGKVRQLSKRQLRGARMAINKSESANSFDKDNVHPLNAVSKAEEFIASIGRYPSRRFKGRGIVICGGGTSYFTNAWVCIRMLRFHGCTLPIELWHLGRSELDHRMESLLAPLNVKCVNARQVMNQHPMRNPLGWELKSFALLNCRFEEVLLLDADNIAVRNPEFLFDCKEYEATGAIFWPDYRSLGSRRAIWKHCGVRYRHEQEFESGQMVVNKKRCWTPVNLSFWYNDHSEFFYQHIHGDKETFHMAWRKLNLEYAMVPFPIKRLEGTMCQHDFSGNRVFQHRNLRKWQLFGENTRVPGFLLENKCLEMLEDLRTCWDGTINGRREKIQRHGFTFRKETFDLTTFENVVFKNEYNLPDSFRPEDVVVDIGAHVGSFAVACQTRGSRSIVCFESNPENAQLARKNIGGLEGVRLFHKAVLHVGERVKVTNFLREKEGQNTGASRVCIDSSGQVSAIAFDTLLRKLGRVRLVKLDCEGSEWPILFFSRELWRVQEICGEFHVMKVHELCPGVRKFDRAQIRRILERWFTRVETTLDKKNPKLGKFWALEPIAAATDASELRLFPAAGSAQKAAA